MKVKIASLNFWDQNTPELIVKGSPWCLDNIIKPSFGEDYEIIDFRKESPDLLFMSCFNLVSIKQTLEKHNCHPKAVIYFTGEHPANRQPNYHYDYSISFNHDSETNVYYPLWLFSKDNLKYRENAADLLKKKIEFCSFIVGNGWLNRDLCVQRAALFDYINDNYKRVDSWGSLKNNMGARLPMDFDEAYPIASKYKFNLCFENTSSSRDLSYVTEKLLNAYAYGCVPIYAGAEDIERWFNKDSFINCNGKSNKEILEMIKEIDEDDSKYKKMLEAPIFNEDIPEDKMKNFLLHIVEKIR